MNEKLDLSAKNMRKFGLTMAACLLVIGLVLFLRHKPLFIWLWAAGLIFFILARAGTALLKPIYGFWMFLAFCLGWFNTRLILILVYYCVVAPIGLAARLLGKDFLDIKLDKSANTYWQKRESGNILKERYERTF